MLLCKKYPKDPRCPDSVGVEWTVGVWGAQLQGGMVGDANVAPVLGPQTPNFFLFPYNKAVYI